MGSTGSAVNLIPVFIFMGESQIEMEAFNVKIISEFNIFNKFYTFKF